MAMIYLLSQNDFFISIILESKTYFCEKSIQI